MSEYKAPASEAEFDKNFSQKKPLMNDTEAYYESSRCLFCYDAPCMKACPTHIDIPLFIKQIHTQNVEGSAKTIFDANWLGNACGKVCPTGVLCEGACVYNHQNVKPIDIGRLQNYATSAVMRKKTPLYKPGRDNGLRVAMVGAGPASIACACELRVLGYTVDIFEAKDKPSGLTVFGVAPYKITNEEALEEVDYLQEQLGFNIMYNIQVSTAENFRDLEEGYSAIFLGVGIGGTATLRLKGEDKLNVIGAVEFIEEVRMNHHKVKMPSRVIVLGGGNTAMDAASAAARLGANTVTLAYRRGKEEMGAYPFEYTLAVGAGVDSLFFAQPTEITGDAKADGVTFLKTQVKNDGSLGTILGSEFHVPCDLVIKATGQAKQKSLFSQITKLELTPDNKLKVNADTFQCSNPKYFAGGDAINGGAEVVNAAYDGKMAARGIHQWLQTKG
jgi:dihydropyrimidine dehydrogenase (NAD+) subunit PreT